MKCKILEYITMFPTYSAYLPKACNIQDRTYFQRKYCLIFSRNLNLYQVLECLSLIFKIKNLLGDIKNNTKNILFNSAAFPL